MSLELDKTDCQASSSPEFVPPYPPSWVDRLIDWIDGLPGPSLLYYLVMALVLLLLEVLIQWARGTYPVGALVPTHNLLNTILIPYTLAGIHYLDRNAAHAMRVIRPAMDVSESEYKDYQYRLTNLPARATLFVTFFAIVYVAINFSNTNISGLFTSLELVRVIGGIILVVFFYHTIYQLRLVMRIYACCTRISLFELDPLYAFSVLTSGTALLIIVFVTALFLISPLEVDLPNAIAILLLAVAVFVLPLLGIHNRIAYEKKSQLAEIARRYDTTLAELYRRVDAQEFETMSNLESTLSNLERGRQTLSKIPTWPWQPETLRNMLAAVVFPLLIRIFQWLADRYLGI